MIIRKGESWCFSVLTVLILLLNINVTLVSGANHSTVPKPNFRIPQESPSGWELPWFAARPGMELCLIR